MSEAGPEPTPGQRQPIRQALGWGVVVGVIQAASPLAFWWLEPATTYAIGLAVIAAVYVGFAVADGRWNVIAVETVVAMTFVVIAMVSITASPWFLVVGFAGHGIKDAWQERGQFVSGTRWWPPFCVVVDWVVAAVIAVEIAAGVNLHR